MRPSRSSARGVAVFALVVLVALAVLLVLAFSQHFLSGVTSQRESVASGRRALYLAESALDEALLDFKMGVNAPGRSVVDWYGLLRQSVGSAGSIEASFYPYFTVESCAGEGGVRVEDVQVVVWSLAPLNDLPYERCGLLTMTAVVGIPRRGGGFFDTYLYRNVQRSYELKQVLLTPPAPFDGWTLFMARWDYLGRALADYLADRGRFDARARQASVALQALMTNLSDFLKTKISGDLRTAQGFLDKLEEVKDFLANLEIEIPPGCGFKVGADTVGWGPDDVQEGVDRALAAYNLDMQRARDIAATDAEAWKPVPNLREVNWPPFRADGAALTNPVCSTKDPLVAGDFPFRFPSWPALPADPVISPAWIYDWDFPQLTYLRDVFQTWISSYDSQVAAPHGPAWEQELRRHEAIFRILGGLPPELSRLGSSYLYRKASWRFADGPGFAAFVGGAGGLALNGAYWVAGPVDLAGPYRGAGLVAAAGDVSVSGTSGSDGGTLTVVSLQGSADVSSNANAAVLAPHGTIHFNGSTLTGLAVENYHAGDDSFTIDYDPAYASGAPDPAKLWVTVSPYEVATNILRRGE